MAATTWPPCGCGVRSLTAWPGDQVSFFEGVDINGNDADAGDKGAIAGVELLRKDDFTYKVKQNDFYAGDTMIGEGRVTAKRVDGARHLVDIDLVVSNQDDVVCCPAFVTAALPTRAV